MQKKHKPLTAANIINRLPLQQQLNSSQAIIIKLSPIWHSWAVESVAKNLISVNCLNSTQLTSLQNGKLVLTCSNSAHASLIKHQQNSLLTFFHQQGFKEINKIVVRIDNHAKQINDHQVTQTNNLDDKPTVQVSNNSLEAIYSCQKTVGNDLLANSLKKLANTLKNKR